MNAIYLHWRSRGIGRNTAIYIVLHGRDVILTERSGRDASAAVVAEIEALGRTRSRAWG
jgi:hypothetical protein